VDFCAAIGCLLHATDRARAISPVAQPPNESFVGRWKRLGIHSGASFSRALLYVLYWTLLLPFGIVAKLGRGRPAFRDDVPPPNTRSQY
jgi:hypothetical protein